MKYQSPQEFLDPLYHLFKDIIILTFYGKFLTQMELKQNLSRIYQKNIKFILDQEIIQCFSKLFLREGSFGGQLHKKLMKLHLYGLK